jgi:hypothetical protein
MTEALTTGRADALVGGEAVRVQSTADIYRRSQSLPLPGPGHPALGTGRPLPPHPEKKPGVAPGRGWGRRYGPERLPESRTRGPG